MAPASFSVSGKTAIITGAGSGINFSFAKLLLSRGCNVTIADLSLRPEADALIAEYNGTDPRKPRAIFVKTDATKWPDLHRMFDETVAVFGSFDIVCPGAGVYEPHWSNFWHPPGSAESKDPVEGNHYSLLDINLTHPIRATQIALSYWLFPEKAPRVQAHTAKASPQNPKRVVHISSVAGQLPVFRAPLYGASKFAVSGFVRCLASLDDAYGVRVNAVAPGIVKTPLWTEHPEKLVNLDQKNDGWVTPEEVAEAMLACVEQDDNVGGTILEVGKEHTRRVGALNDPGPNLTQGYGIWAGNGSEGDDMVWKWLKSGDVWGFQGRSKL
ncbi:unnamed protein product [Clonostachys byssicola]|uniref:Uncharacterized protein n=1 Tax=Clonostachys byssicola TaxID=160290 RepID=A0A9N9U9P9_9HYPO|nr:unnamed protein product [Clonostachys byssicola]